MISVLQAQRWNATAHPTPVPCALRVPSGVLLSSGTGAKAASIAPPSARRDSLSRRSVMPHTTGSVSVYRDTTSLWSSASHTAPVRLDQGSLYLVIINTALINVSRPRTRYCIFSNQQRISSNTAVSGPCDSSVTMEMIIFV